MFQSLILYLFNSLKLYFLPFSSVKTSCTQNYPALNFVRPVFIQQFYKQNPSQEIVKAAYYYLEMGIRIACQFSLLESVLVSHLFRQEHRKKAKGIKEKHNHHIVGQKLWEGNIGRQGCWVFLMVECEADFIEILIAGILFCAPSLQKTKLVSM